jgi:hypothetical protein
MQKVANIHIIGGGTVSHVRAHLALAAVAYGGTARDLRNLCYRDIPEMNTILHFTRMAGGEMETNEDVAKLVKNLVKDKRTKVIFMTAALVDYSGEIDGVPGEKYAPRLKTREGFSRLMSLTPTQKIISSIGSERKDITLVGFKTTCGATRTEQYLAGLHLLKENSCNLVFANDIKTRLNMVIVPEEAKYFVTKDRQKALEGLVHMVKMRSQLTFTRSTVIAGDPIPWKSPLVPKTLRKVVDHCIKRKAYKPFRGVTAGHFACKLSDTTFLTSRRKTNFNDLQKVGLVKVETSGPDTVLAYGSKPSVGGQSQRIVFQDHPETDCIVHFHSPLKKGSRVPTASQMEVECGSHQCGKNTSTKLKKFGNLKAVYLDNHGPNIVFSKDTDPTEVIDFIEKNFDLDQKTGGLVTV